MSWNTDQRFAQFEVDAVKFMLTFQDGDIGLDAVLLYWDGSQWLGWGGQPSERATIVENIDDAKILAHGSLYGFLEYLCTEAMRRAKLKAELQLPDPNDRIARFKYNMLMSVDSDGKTLTVKPPPLP